MTSLWTGYTKAQRRAIESVLAENLEPLDALSLDELPEMEDPMPDDPDEPLPEEPASGVNHLFHCFAEALGNHSPKRPVLVKVGDRVDPTAYGLEACLDGMELRLIGIEP